MAIRVFGPERLQAQGLSPHQEGSAIYPILAPVSDPGVHEQVDLAIAHRRAPGEGEPEPAIKSAGGHVEAVPAEEGTDPGGTARPGPDHGVADGQAAAHIPLGIGEPMRRATHSLSVAREVATAAVCAAMGEDLSLVHVKAVGSRHAPV
jgi:hypothetical protein